MVKRDQNTGTFPCSNIDMGLIVEIIIHSNAEVFDQPTVRYDRTTEVLEGATDYLHS